MVNAECTGLGVAMRPSTGVIVNGIGGKARQAGGLPRSLGSMKKGSRANGPQNHREPNHRQPQ